MDIFKKFLIVCMHIVSLWAFKCLFKFLVASSNPEVMLPVQATIFMLFFYGGLTLMTVFYWIAYFNNREKSLKNNSNNVFENTKSNENHNTDNIVTEEKKVESEININYEKVLNNIKTLFTKLGKPQNNSFSLYTKILKIALILIALVGLIIPSFIVDLAPEFWCANYDGYIVVRVTSIIILLLVFISPYIFHLFKKVSILSVLKPHPMLLLAIFLLGTIGFGIYKMVDSNTLPKCDSKFAEDEVIEIFKQNNELYKKYHQYNLVGDIRLSSITPESYDKDIKKYECSARLILTPNKSKIQGLPNSIWDRGSFVNHPYMRGSYERAVCNLDYSIYKEHGENTVKSSYCGNHLDMEYPIDPYINIPLR